MRTLGQAERVIEHAGRARPEARRGRRQRRPASVIMMCEVPSNAILAEQFLEHFDGMSIGSNDLTQLTLGLDRDSGLELLARGLRRARPGRQGADLARHRGLPRAPASTSASAARARATTPTSPTGWPTRASSRSRSTPTAWSTPGSNWRAAEPRVTGRRGTTASRVCYNRGLSLPHPVRRRGWLFQKPQAAAA